ncbi:MAG: hypothetical protein KGZ82_09755 [Bacteroidales bacterium]|nr:hypothetical protein [Bacteroidales bacterium]
MAWHPEIIRYLSGTKSYNTGSIQSPQMKALTLISKLLPLVLLLSLVSCSQKPAAFDYGKVENGVYLNSYFDFSMQLPEGWAVQSRDQMENIANTGKKMLSGNDTNLEAVLSAAEVNVANLLAVFEKEMGSPVEYNPNIMIVAENLQHAPGIKSGFDYLYQSRKLLMQGQFQYDYLSENFELVEFDGVEFYRMDARVNFTDLEIKQHYYATVRNGFSFNVIISYVSDAQKTVLFESLGSMRFGK